MITVSVLFGAYCQVNSCSTCEQLCEQFHCVLCVFWYERITQHLSEKTRLLCLYYVINSSQFVMASFVMAGLFYSVLRFRALCMLYLNHCLVSEPRATSGSTKSRYHNSGYNSRLIILTLPELMLRLAGGLV